jgi:hypothetical protein
MMFAVDLTAWNVVRRLKRFVEKPAGQPRHGAATRWFKPSSFDSERTSERIVPGGWELSPVAASRNAALAPLGIFLELTIYFAAAPVAASTERRLRLRGRNSLLIMWSWRRGRDADVVSAGSTQIFEGDRMTPPWQNE